MQKAMFSGKGLKLGPHPFFGIHKHKNFGKFSSHTFTVSDLERNLRIQSLNEESGSSYTWANDESSFLSCLWGSHSYSSLIYFPSNFNIILRIYIIQYTVTCRGVTSLQKVILYILAEMSRRGRFSKLYKENLLNSIFQFIKIVLEL
jgi:hypothetical protein